MRIDIDHFLCQPRDNKKQSSFIPFQNLQSQLFFIVVINLLQQFFMTTLFVSKHGEYSFNLRINAQFPSPAVELTGCLLPTYSLFQYLQDLGCGRMEKFSTIQMIITLYSAS